MALYHFPVIFQTQIYTDLHGFDFDQILSITNVMESYDIDHNNLKSVLPARPLGVAGIQLRRS